jgi:hypothetical protein
MTNSLKIAERKIGEQQGPGKNAAKRQETNKSKANFAQTGREKRNPDREKTTTSRENKYV